MTSFNVTSVAIAVACLSLSGVASAQMREPVQARIQTADLDLANAAGRAALDRRIRQAASVSCQSGALGLQGAADTARCRREMLEDSRNQIAALTARHATLQVAALLPAR